MTSDKSSSSNPTQNTSLATLEEASKGIDTGTLIPQNLTVRLVRADTSWWETALTLLFSTFLTFFGLFLGSWLSRIDSEFQKFSNLEKTATFIFGILSIVLLIIWIILKINQHRKAVKIPYDVFKSVSSF